MCGVRRAAAEAGAAGSWEATILALLLWDKLGGLLGMEKGSIFILRK